VDINVRNPDDQATTVPGAFKYASPDSFDFNGHWFAYLGNGDDDPIAFTIQNNALTTVECPDVGPTAISPASPVNFGEVFASGPSGIIFSARIVSPATAVGTVKLSARCTSGNWTGWKDTPAGIFRRPGR
jgi:hypothetical protein